MNHALLPNVATARLPGNFKRAKAAMLVCLKSEPSDFPAKYLEAQTALQECASVDECAAWPDKMAAMASYARQSGDKSLESLARRIRARLSDLGNQEVRQ